MAPPKKGQKMGLGEFLGDQSLGSWADEMEDMPMPTASSGYGSTRRDYGAGSGGSAFGASRGGDERYPSRDPLPIPDKAPFTVHIANLSYDAVEGEIEEFFEKNGCEVANVRLVRDRMEDKPKGFGYCEFKTRDSLVIALDLSGMQLAGRNIKVSVADPPKDRPDDRTFGEWRRTGPLPPLEQPARRGFGSEDGGRGGRRGSYEQRDDKVRDFGNWERKGPLTPLAPPTPTGSDGGRPLSGDRDSMRRRSPARPPMERQPSAAERDNEWRRGARPDAPQRSVPTSPSLSQTRPKLNLQKRSEQPIQTATTTSGDSKASPFGGAKPIDTLKREREVEEKRLAAAKERAEREEQIRKEREEARLAKLKASEESAAERRGSAHSEVPTEGEGPKTPTGPASSIPTSPAASAGGDAQRETKTMAERPKVPDNWRSRGPPHKQSASNQGGQGPPRSPRDQREPRDYNRNSRDREPRETQNRDVRVETKQPEKKEDEDAGTPTEQPAEDGWTPVGSTRGKKGRNWSRSGPAGPPAGQ